MLEITKKKLNPSDGFKDSLEVSTIIATNRKDLQKKVQGFKGKLVIVEGSEINREILETKNVDILMSPEKLRKDDFMHHRNSGLNHILCNLARKNRIAIGFNFLDLLKSKGVERARVLGRMRQNVVLCRKYKTKVVLACLASNEYEQRSAFELEQFGIAIGLTQKESKEAVSSFNNIIKSKAGRIKPGLRVTN